jgi:hypothetical protein
VEVLAEVEAEGERDFVELGESGGVGTAFVEESERAARWVEESWGLRLGGGRRTALYTRP